MHAQDGRISLRAFLMGIMFAAFFAAISVYIENHRSLYLTATQLPVLPFVLLLAMVLLVNPVCRLLRFIRPFTAAEVLIVFIMGLVSAGIATFGLTGPLVPIVSGLFNPAWNTEQTAWNRHVVPYLNEDYFVAETGIQDAAAAYAHAYRAHREKRQVLATARRYLAARERLDALHDGITAPDQGALTVAHAARELARAEWDALRAKRPELPDANEVATTRDHRLESSGQALAEAREHLRALETRAFERVTLFRRGLPRHLRAYPGFIKLPEDTWNSYAARIRRMREGHAAAGEARAALALIADNSESLPDDAEWMDRLQSLEQRLSRMSDSAALAADLEAKTDAIERLNREIREREEKLRELHRAKRTAYRDALRPLNRRIQREQRTVRALHRERETLVETRDYLHQQIAIPRQVAEWEYRIGALASATRAGTRPQDAPDTLRALLDSLPSVDGCPRRFMAGDVPWRDWAGPLSRWALAIALTYLVLMTFNVLIFRQWAYHEKLIYPLAELPIAMVGGATASRQVPALFRGGLFWAGLAVSGAFLGYNALAATEWIPAFEALNLRNPWTDYLHDTPFQGLLYGRFSRSEIFFTMIGLSFLIPKHVSFSLWFFAVLSMAQVLLLVALGYGETERSFPSELYFIMNFRTAQGGGALLVFSSVVLYKCRRYLLCAFNPRILDELPDDERRELRLSSFGFLGGSIGLIGVLWFGMGIHPVYSIGGYAMIMIITIGLIRAVAEGGILGFQCYTNPFHFVRTFFGFDKSWTSAPLIAPFFIYYGILFLDLKTFIAPAMANSLKIRDELRMRRGRFHLAILAAIVVAAVVAVGFSIMMAYSRGADMMGNWFYSRLPRIMFDHIADMSRAPLQSSPFEAGWIVAGALGMSALLFFRQTMFWLPHPIGMVMLLNPTMGAYWFSILLGWIAKSLVTKYGNQEVYAKARTFFIGLIAGELLIVALSLVLSLRLDIRIPIDLNR